jgi:hypothetical protein
MWDSKWDSGRGTSQKVERPSWVRLTSLHPWNMKNSFTDTGIESPSVSVAEVCYQHEVSDRNC